MRNKLLKRFIVLFLCVIFAFGIGNIAMAANNNLIMNKEYEKYTVYSSTLGRQYVKFNSTGQAEFGVTSYVADKNKSYNPKSYVFYQGKKYYILGGAGDIAKYQVDGSEVTMKVYSVVYDDDGNEKEVYLDINLRIRADGSLQVIQSPFSMLKAGDILTLPSSDKQSADVKITLSKTKVTGNGKAQKPKVTVKYDGKKLSSKYYSVSYSSNKYPGLATVTVKGKGTYKNKISATKLNFVITPAKMKAPTVKVGKASLKVSCKALIKVDGYEVQISTKKKFNSDVQKYTTTSSKTKSITGLKSKKTYYVRTRAYKTINGTKYYGSWSSAKKVKTK